MAIWGSTQDALQMSRLPLASTLSGVASHDSLPMLPAPWQLSGDPCRWTDRAWVAVAVHLCHDCSAHVQGLQRSPGALLVWEKQREGVSKALAWADLET